jgi:AmiR/NasT family two-component response regulator
VLIANERPVRLEAIVRELGHDVVAREVDAAHAGSLTRKYRPDLALVGLGEHSEHALALIETIVHESACPVIAIVRGGDLEFVRQAARRGVFASVDIEDSLEDVRNAIEIALARFAAFQDLEGAFGRRAVIERAKGILMERHGIDDDAAFALLRGEARRNGRKLVDVATSVTESHLLLPAQPGDAAV